MDTGAQAVIEELLSAGVRVCFANPGTSEMHFVAALDNAPGMRAVLTLFEGVATGAADGYARITSRPAATLLHLGPGLANGLANLHNARRAHSPVLNIVGDHATYHQQLDAPMQSDIGALARWLCGPVYRPECPDDLRPAIGDAVSVASIRPGRIATLILPADLSWGPTPIHVSALREDTSRDEHPEGDSLDTVAEVLRRAGQRAVLLVGGSATTSVGQRAAWRIAQATGARVYVETFPARMTCGAGAPYIERIGHLAEHAEQQLCGTTDLVLAGVREPVALFAYPQRSGQLVPDGARVHILCSPAAWYAAQSLEALAHRLGAYAPTPPLPALPAVAPGALTVQNWAEVIAALTPENAIISDESNTSGALLAAATAGSPRHDLLTLTGGAIGQGLPLAVGAAVAAPLRPVIALQADGSALYTISALWTMAREELNITTVILNNRSYAILKMELQRVGAPTGGGHAGRLLDLSHPDIDFVKIAHGMGVSATTEELAEQFLHATNTPGPHLIEAIIPALL